MSVGRVIRSNKCILEGVEWLAQQDSLLAGVLEKTGTPPLRLRPQGFEQLLNSIVSQQVSVAAAEAIWKKLECAKLTRPSNILRASDQELRATGLSRQKMRYARELADAKIDFKSLNYIGDREVIDILVKVPGIGIWTAEIYIMFSLGRADVFAAGDLALQESARLLLDMTDRPRDRELRKIAEKWSPWRAVAARMLWANYRYIRNREGIR
ncbi:MAG: DNA-3-methyladenine glycosylase 2 family protein [Aestuariivita sp.]|nr:DNA-3-methyladenine glycosylase 2 family protein [Aestuariivita sp.]